MFGTKLLQKVEFSMQMLVKQSYLLFLILYFRTLSNSIGEINTWVAAGVSAKSSTSESGRISVTAGSKVTVLTMDLHESGKQNADQNNPDMKIIRFHCRITRSEKSWFRSKFTLN